MAEKNFLLASCLSALICVSQVSYAQTQVDSLSLPIFEPNDIGIGILDDVVATKHQLLTEYGTYIIHGEDNNDIVKIDFDTTWWFGINEANLQKYYGCIVYKGKFFVLDGSLKRVGCALFNRIGLCKKIPKPEMPIDIKNDRIITWTFALIDGMYRNVNVSPPSICFDFDY